VEHEEGSDRRHTEPPAGAAILDRAGYELEVEDRFDRPELDQRLWIP
jgi:hypothetical protein